jgi:hypothetical protein
MIALRRASHLNATLAGIGTMVQTIAAPPTKALDSFLTHEQNENILRLSRA